MGSAAARTGVSQSPGWGVVPCSSEPDCGGSQHRAPPQPEGACRSEPHRPHQLKPERQLGELFKDRLWQIKDLVQRDYKSLI